MLVPTIIMAVLAGVLFIIAYRTGGDTHVQGVKQGLILTVEVLPLLLFAFIMAGLVQVLLPQDLVARWVGAESGLRGIIIGTVAGGLTPGGPYVSLPIVAGLLKAGAGVGTLVAFLTGWSLYAVARLPMEVGILGWKLTVVRFVSVLIFPPLAGLLAQWMVKLLNISV